MNFHSICLYCVVYLKKFFFKKKYLKAISKVHVIFNELQIKFKCNPQKMVFTDFTRNYAVIEKIWLNNRLVPPSGNSGSASDFCSVLRNSV